MDLRHILVVCGIRDLRNPEWNRLMQLYIDYQGFTGIYGFSMVRIKDAPHMIKDHNLVPNQYAHVGTTQQHKSRVLVWRAKYF